MTEVASPRPIRAVKKARKGCGHLDVMLMSMYPVSSGQRTFIRDTCCQYTQCYIPKGQESHFHSINKVSAQRNLQHQNKDSH